MDEAANTFVTQRGAVQGTAATAGGVREALVRKRESAAAEEEQLDARKQAIRARALRCDAAEVRLRERAADMEQRRQLFAKLEAETTAKCEAAVSRAAEEHALVAALDAELREKTELVNRLEAQRVEGTALAESLSWCQRFLQRVVESSDEFLSVADVLSRYDTLQRAHTVSETQQQRQKEEVERLRAETDSLTKRHRDQVFVLDTELATRKKLLEEERSRTEDLSARLQADSSTSVERLRTQGQLLNGVRNLCSRMDPQRIPDTEDLGELLSRLTKLGSRLVDLHDVVAEGQQQQHSPTKQSDH